MLFVCLDSRLRLSILNIFEGRACMAREMSRLSRRIHSPAKTFVQLWYLTRSAQRCRPQPWAQVPSKRCT